MKTRTAPAAIASDRLPAEFARPRTDHIRVRFPQLPLPFIGSLGRPVDGCFWDVPPVGGYFGGYQTGEALALWLLKSWRAGDADWGVVGLAYVAESIMYRFTEYGGAAMAQGPHAALSEEFASFRGQYFGFFNTLFDRLMSSPRRSSTLDTIGLDELLERANQGLSFDSAAYAASQGA